MEVLPWCVLFYFILRFSCHRRNFFRLQDSGSERDGMQPHDGKFCSFFLELILNINYPIFSAGLLDVMCKFLAVNFGFTQRRKKKPVIYKCGISIRYFQRRCGERSNRASIMSIGLEPLPFVISS